MYLFVWSCQATEAVFSKQATRTNKRGNVCKMQKWGVFTKSVAMEKQ
jgi:hypothetical protein